MLAGPEELCWENGPGRRTLGGTTRESADAVDVVTIPDDDQDLTTLELAFPGALRDRLVDAIRTGAKSATTSLVVERERRGRALPHLGERQVVLDSAGEPAAEIETTARPRAGDAAHDHSRRLIGCVRSLFTCRRGPASCPLQAGGIGLSNPCLACPAPGHHPLALTLKPPGGVVLPDPGRGPRTT